MGAKTKIEWTQGEDGTAGSTWTPIRARNRETGKVGWFCEHVSPGCENCYAESLNIRLGNGIEFKPWHRKDVEMFLDEEMLLWPLKWKKPRTIFACSMTDLFASFVPDDWIDKIFSIMALAHWQTFQVLTKRPERMLEYINNHPSLGSRGGAGGVPWPLPNVWLGSSVEDQRRFDERWPILRETPAAIRFLSIEPQLERIDMCEKTRDVVESNRKPVGCRAGCHSSELGNYWRRKWS